MRKLLGGAGIALVVLVMLFVKVHLSGQQQYKEALSYMEAGETWDAIHALDKTLHWYTPVSGYIGQAAGDLWTIGEKAEAGGDTEQALVAYRTLRSGFYAARSFYTPGEDWIAKADEKITALASTQPDFMRRNQEMTDEERREAVARHLRKDRAPDVFWSVVVEIGFFGWVLGAAGFIWFVLGASGGWNRRRALFWGLAIVGFYAIWIVGMLKA